MSVVEKFDGAPILLGTGNTLAKNEEIIARRITGYKENDTIMIIPPALERRRSLGSIVILSALLA